MDRRAVVEALLKLDRPVPEIETELSRSPWDCDEELAVLTVPLLVSVLTRYLDGELSAEQLEEWANLVEVRDDVGFDPAHYEYVRETVFRLANSALEGPITPETVESLLSEVRARG